MGELWDIYDCSYNKTGRLHERGSAMNKGEFHLVVQIWLINNKGEFLISQRVDTGESDGMWHTTGGCAVSGDDSLVAALRETKEELGINLDPKNGKLFMQNIVKHTNDDGAMFGDVWVFRQEVDISSVVFQPDEICDAMWASKEKISKMIDDGIFLSEWYPYLDALFHYIGS